MNELWRKTKDLLEKRLVSGVEFDGILKDLLEKIGDDVRIQYILSDKDNNQYKFGICGDGNPSASYNVTLEDDYSLKMDIWQKHIFLKEEECKDMFQAYWNNCDCVTGMSATDRRSYIKKCDFTVNEWLREGKKMAFFMIDLDHFKEINTKRNHSIGTKVISEFSRLLLKTINGRGILIHQSGDEFDLLLIYKDVNMVMKLAHEIFCAVGNYSFSEEKDIQLTMAMGVWLSEKTTEVKFMDARNSAENAYDQKVKNGGKQRNSVRISMDRDKEEFGKTNYKLALVRIMTNLHNNIFHNIFLDYISYYSSTEKIDGNFQKMIDVFLEWVNPQSCNAIRCTCKTNLFDTKAEFSCSEVALAVLQGLLTNNSICGCKICMKTQDNKIMIFVDEKCIYTTKNEVFEEDILCELSEYSKLNQKKCQRKVILVYAGYNAKIDIPEDVFYKVVRVDTRPTIGGGLPDSWASILSVLITYMDNNSEFSDIIISGDLDNTKKVKYYLQNIEKWGNDDEALQYKYIAQKLYRSESEICRFQQRFKEHVFTVFDNEEIISCLYSIQESAEFQLYNQMRETELLDRFLERNLSYDNIALRYIDGCRVKTIAEAFPIVLEIMRKYSNEPGTRKIKDQANRELIEVIDFKIVLQTPGVNKLPQYYNKDQKELNEYYDNILGKKDALFRTRIEKDKQLSAVMEHIAIAIKGKNSYSTRRAILVVPNEIKFEQEYSPVGLVAIWMAPRFVENSVVVDFSYTWRTVEAIVGLPLSLYASVMFSEELTDMIQEKCSDMRVEMGHVSYIANSLHMFMDDAGIDIVRGIVNEVSI